MLTGEKRTLECPRYFEIVPFPLRSVTEGGRWWYGKATRRTGRNVEG